MKKSIPLMIGSLVLAGSGLVGCGRAIAEDAPVATQDAGGATLEQVVVTAQRRRQLAQDVGIVINAYTGAQLQQMGISRATDVAYSTPGVFVGGSLAGQSSQFTIRGVSPNDFNDISESPIATYLDDAYIGVSVGQSMAVFDTQRVEVLQGPQSTLFGRNATGGVVRYISNQPELNVFSGYARASYGRFDSPLTAGRYREDAALNIPVRGDLALRLSGTSTVQNNYIKNLYPQGAPPAGSFGGGSPGAGAGADLGQDNNYGVRGILLYQPQDSLSMSLELNAVHSISGVGPYTQRATVGVFDSAGRLANVVNTGPGETRASSGPGGTDFGADPGNIGVFTPLTRPTPGGDYFGYVAPPASTFTESTDFSFGHMNHTGAASATGHISWDIRPDLQLSSITNVTRFYSLQFIDVDAGPGNQLANYHQDHTRQYSQEVRLSDSSGGSHWVTGIYFLGMDNFSNNGLKSPSAGLDIPAVAHLKTDSYSVFGQADEDLGGPWSLIVGARLDNERKIYDLAQELFLAPSPLLVQQGQPIAVFGPPPTFSPYHGSMNSWLWAAKAQLDYRPMKDLLWYLGVNRGVKAGSYNAPLPAGQGAVPTYLVPDSAIRYSPEALWNYEAGWKWTGLQGKLLVDGSIYFYDYRNYQAFLFTGVSGAVMNRDATNYGAGLEIKALPIPSLEVGIALSAFHFVVNHVPFGFGSDAIVRNVQPTYAPPVQANVSGRYRLPWRLASGDLSVNAMVNYTDYFYYNLRDFSADSFPSSTNVNLGLSWLSEKGDWTVRLDAHNVTNALIPVMGFDLATLCGCNEVSYQPPRLVSIGVERDF